MDSPKPVDGKMAMQLFIAGEVTATAIRIDADLLQAYLDTKPEGFYYMDVCSKIVELKNTIIKRPHVPPVTRSSE